jgi:hypothetical protein
MYGKIVALLGWCGNNNFRKEHITEQHRRKECIIQQTERVSTFDKMIALSGLLVIEATAEIGRCPSRMSKKVLEMQEKFLKSKKPLEFYILTS